MTVDRHVLGMSVDQDQGPSAGSAESAEGYSSGCSGRDSVAGHSSGSDEEAGDFFHKRRHEGAFIAAFYLLSADDRNGCRNTEPVHFDPGSGHY